MNAAYRIALSRERRRSREAGQCARVVIYDPTTGEALREEPLPGDGPATIIHIPDNGR